MSGIIHLRVGIQSLKADLDFYVFDLHPGLDAWLGNTWLDRHKAQILYGQLFRVKQGMRWHSLMSERDAYLLSPPEMANLCFLSAIQVKKMMKEEQCKTLFHVNVSQLKETREGTKPQDFEFEESLRGYESVFDPLPPGLPPYRGVKHTIDYRQSPPVSNYVQIEYKGEARG